MNGLSDNAKVQNNKPVFRYRPAVLGISILLFSLATIIILWFGPFGMEKTWVFTDYLFSVLLFFHILWGTGFFIKSKRLKTLLQSLYALPEIFFALNLILFLFSFIFASNANMDYVQRFAEMAGNLRLAPDSGVQRLNSLLLHIPLLLSNILVYTLSVIWRPGAAKRFISKPGASQKSLGYLSITGMPLALFAGLLYAFSFPSFLSVKGWGFLAYLTLVPLFLCFSSSRFSFALTRGVTGFVTGTMLTNFWLGTFSLVSLQLITVVSMVWYIPFFALLIPLWTSLSSAGQKFYRKSKVRHSDNSAPQDFQFRKERLFLTSLIPALGVSSLWVFFDYIRSLGFLGYPWGILGTSQYRYTPLIQTASITGIWGVNWFVLFISALLALIALSFLDGRRIWKQPSVFAVVITGAVLIHGNAVLYLGDFSRDETVVVSLIQQNTDPRKDDYQKSFGVLKDLTDKALLDNPDLVAWSETAFVPNIRRWSQEDPRRSFLARLVRDFLEYQKGTGTWLLTGNDDYDHFFIDGVEHRKDYNAAILFSSEGERRETYHKIRLVPFTEYFPYREIFPRFYKILLEFDVHLWEPGTERTVFKHPKFTFSSPICFEDSFPNEVRLFVKAGADVILNLSNDFWSLTEVEALQHFANALFRAVENRRPLLRSAASGVTGYVDSKGRIISALPCYEEGFITVRVGLPKKRMTIYTRFGDWFVVICAAAVIICAVYSGRLRKHSENKRKPPRS